MKGNKEGLERGVEEIVLVVMKGFRSKLCIPMERDRQKKEENKAFKVVKKSPQ